MPTFQWVADIGGVAKNHALSQKIREQALAETRVEQFTDIEPGYGKGKGETVNIETIITPAIPSDPTLSEGQTIPRDTLTRATRAITVQELGRGLEYTNLARQLTFYDLKQKAQWALKEQLRLMMDKLAADAFKRTQLKYAATGITTLNKALSGTFGASATVGLTVDHIQQMRDDLASVYFAAPWDGNFYMGLFATKACTSLRRDPDWKEPRMYLDPGKAHYEGEIGSIRGVRIVEITHGSAFSGTIGTGSAFGEGVIFGRDAVAEAVALDPELRLDVPEDAGRVQAIVWYGILRFEPVHAVAPAVAGRANIIHFGST